MGLHLVLSAAVLPFAAKCGLQTFLDGFFPLGTREKILVAALDIFNELGYERATIEEIRRAASVSNGSFFYYFNSKDSLAAALFLDSLRSYHSHLVTVLAGMPAAGDGVAALVRAHLEWVTTEKRRAVVLFKLTREEWLGSIRADQDAENQDFGTKLDAWRKPLEASGHLRQMEIGMFISQLIGPSQMFCRAWLSGRGKDDPCKNLEVLAQCAVRTLVLV